jgi:hypothetical protein
LFLVRKLEDKFGDLFQKKNINFENKIVTMLVAWLGVNSSGFHLPK